MNILGAGYPCERCSDAETMVRCRFPDSGPGRCHHCNEGVPPAPVGLENSTRFCTEACGNAWSTEHPGYWTPIEDTLPGGRYDGIWENSGLRLDYGGNA